MVVERNLDSGIVSSFTSVFKFPKWKKNQSFKKICLEKSQCDVKFCDYIIFKKMDVYSKEQQTLKSKGNVVWEKKQWTHPPSFMSWT